MAGPVVVIPARMASTRLPGKPLADVCGRALILRVLDGVSSSGLSRLAVATDSEQIQDVVVKAGYEAILTGKASSGSERVFAAWKTMGCPGERIINLQGDEPLVDSSWIDALNSKKMTPKSVVTLAKRIKSIDARESSVVKVVTNSEGKALYFSRSLIPYGAETVLHHVGVYCFTPESITFCASSPAGELGSCENLEQLGWMENGVDVSVVTGNWNALGVDTPSDLEEARKWFSSS